MSSLVHTKLLLGILGNATSTIVFISPLPTVLKIFKVKSTQGYSGLPYVCTLFNCLLWVLYGMPFVKPHSMLIITINVFGVAMELFFVFFYMAFTTKSQKIQMTRYLVGVVILYVAIIIITILALHSSTTRQLVVGSFCVVMGIGMYAAPLSVMGLVIHTKSVEYMPITCSVCNFVNSIVWMIYSFVTRDIFIAIPNGIGCISGLIQLILYALYFKCVVSIECSEQNKMQRKTGNLHIVTVASGPISLEK